MEYGLPKKVEIKGEWFDIRYDYRVMLDIFYALNDDALDDEERAYVVLNRFYMDFDALPDYDEAIEKFYWFANGGQNADNGKKQPKLVDWGKDFSLVVSPVNRILGYEIRAMEYDPEANTGGVHWWTFLSAYMEIGDCLFSQVIRIRDLQARGKALDKSDREFYRRNRDIIDLPEHRTVEENRTIDMWLGKKETSP